jgi:hypothetical protein
MPMFALGNPIFLGSVRTRDTVNNPCVLKVSVKMMVFTTPIRPNRFNLSIQETLHMSLKSIEYLFNIRLMFKKIGLSEPRVIIDKVDIVFVPPRRNTGWTPDISMD